MKIQGSRIKLKSCILYEKINVRVTFDIFFNIYVFFIVFVKYIKMNSIHMKKKD